MDATFEARWFFRGPVPEAVRDWFSALDPQKKSERTDLYLHAADPALNVKVRGGKAQAKRRVPGGGPVQPNGCVSGRAEHWRKFSFKTKDRHPLASEDRETGLWAPVAKARHQRVLAPDDLAALDGWDAGAMADGMEAKIELTEVQLDDADWWTICAESEGTPDALEAAFDLAARHLFEDFPEQHALTPADARGYAQWLLDEWHPPALEREGSPEIVRASS